MCPPPIKKKKSSSQNLQSIGRHAMYLMLSSSVMAVGLCSADIESSSTCVLTLLCTQSWIWMEQCFMIMCLKPVFPCDSCTVNK